MKAITELSKMPKFLQIGKWQIDQSYNKYLPMPYRLGEVVKVQPAEFQKPNHDYDHMTPRVNPTRTDWWRERYVAILRKDVSGKFACSCVVPWSAVNFLKKVAK